MLRLFDHQLPSPHRQRERDDRERDDEPAPLPPGDAPTRVWRHLLDHGADPFLLAALLREGIPRAERERAFRELVRSIGLPQAQDARARAFGDGPPLARHAFPVAARELAELATGTSLVGIHAATGELVELVAARLGTAAFTRGSEVFISDAGGGQAVLAPDAVIAAQPRGVSRRGPLAERDGFLARERARAALAVRAALGRAPAATPRPDVERPTREGQALPAALRGDLEPLLGRSLAEVRVHDDAEAHRRAAELDAAAFTDGAHIHFAAGRFDPHGAAGRHLLAHELAHVAQQTGTAPTAGRALTTAPGSAAEQEADRVAAALSARVAPSPIRERVAPGTIARKEASAPVAGAHAWVVQLFHQALSFDPTHGIDTKEGTRKLTLPRTRVGAVTLRDAQVKLDGAGSVESGTLSAQVDDGRLRGSVGTLHVDKDGHVTGSLGLVVAVPQVLAKQLALSVGPDGLEATAPLHTGDFLSTDLPIEASDLVLTVRSGASGLDAQLTGAATAKLDRSFAGGNGRFTAELSHSGAPGIDATIKTALEVRGLNAVADATIKWDGKRFDLQAAASVALTIPGLRGNAALSYKNGAMHVQIPDLQFDWKPLADRLKFGPFSIVDGRLVGQVELGQKLRIDLPGVALTLDEDTNLAVAGERIDGVAAGHLTIGAKSAPVLDADFALHWHDGQIDGEATVKKALLPFLQVEGLKVGIVDIGGANEWSFGGDIEIHFRKMQSRGRWKLPRFKAGSLFGDIRLDFDWPKLHLPSLDFSLLPDWHLGLPKVPDLSIDLDLSELLGRAGALFGKLAGIKLDLGLKPTDLFHLLELIGEIRFHGVDLKLPKLSFAWLRKLDLKLPNFAVDGFDLSKLSGLIDLRFDFKLPGLDVPELSLGFDAGRLIGKLHVDVDIARIFRFLRGKLSIHFDLDGLLRIDVSGLSLADPHLARYADAALKWLGDRFSGSLKLHGEVPWKHLKLRVLGGEIKLDDLKPTGFIEVAVAGEKHKAKVKLRYDDKGELKVEGQLDFDAATVTKGWLTGVLSVGNYGGANVVGGKVTFAKGPLVGKLKEIDARYNLDTDDFSASLSFDNKAFDPIPGVALRDVGGALSLKRTGDVLSFAGAVHGKVKAGSYFDGKFVLGDRNGKLYGELTADKSGLGIKLPDAVKLALDKFKVAIDDELRLADGDTIIGINVHDFIVGDLALHVAGHAITGFHFHGRAKETRFTQAAPELALGYRDGAWSGHAAVKLKSLGGIIDDGAALAVDGSSDAGITVAAHDVVFQKGLLKGFKIVEAHLRNDSFGATIAGGGELRFGPVAVSIAPGSTLSFDKVVGLGGNVSGKLSFGSAASVDFMMSGHGDELDVVVKGRLQLGALSKALEGEVEVGWDKNIKQLTFAALNPGFADSRVKQIAHVDWVKWDGHDFDVHVSILHKELSVGEGRTARVIGGHVTWNHGKLDGEITARSGNVTVTAGWRNGEFFLGAGGEFDLGKLTNKAVTGRVRAEGSTTGRARFKILEDINVAALPGVKITSLEGDIEHGHFKVGLEAASLGKAVKIPMVTLSKLHVAGTLDYDDGKLALDGDVSGEGKLRGGGKDLVRGKFKLSYHDGAFGGTLSNVEILVSKKLKQQGLAIEYDGRVTKISGALSFSVPKIISEATFKPDVDLAKEKFAFSSVLHFMPKALQEVAAKLERKDGQLHLSLELHGDRPIKVGGATLVLKEGSQLDYDEKTESVTGKLVGTAQLGKVASGAFNVSFVDGKLSGDIDLKVNKIPFLKAGTDIKVSFAGGLLNTKEPIKLELDDKYKEYLDATVAMSVHDNDIRVSGEVKRIKKLGKLGEKISEGKVWFDAKDETIGASGTLDLSWLSFLDRGSHVNLSIDSALNFGAKGELIFKKAKGVDLAGALTFEWAPGHFKMSGGVQGSIYNMAEIELHASAGPVDHGDKAQLQESEHLDFHLAGKLTAKGLQARFKQLRFSDEPTVSFWMHGGDGGFDYGMDKFHTRIVALPGIGPCDVALDASYAKDKGLDASVQINDLHFKMLKMTGGLSIKESKFENAELDIVSTLKAVNLKGRVAIHAGELDSLDAEASLDVAPTSGSGLRWIEGGGVKVGLKKGKLDTVDGKLKIRKPPLLPLENTLLELHKNGEEIEGKLETKFPVPFGKGKKGDLTITFGGEKHWSVRIDAEIKPPGFKSGSVSGYADGDGHFKIGGKIEADNPKRIREGHLELGYDEGFFLKGGVTLKLSDTLDGSVDIEYVQGTDSSQDDFKLVGEIHPHEEKPPKMMVPLGGFEPDIPDIPLGGIGVIQLVLEIDLALGFGIIMPYVQFQGLKLVGSLRQLEDGHLPEIEAKARLGMGASVHFELGVALAGKIDLVVATAKAGIRGKLTADAPLNAYSDSNVVFGGNRDGVDIGVDATVEGGIDLKAELEAFLKAKAFGFTIVNEKWELARFNIATIKLPNWKPFDPFTFNVGGSNPGFKGGWPSLRKETPPGLTKGASDSSEAANEQAKQEKAKENVKPVMRAILHTARYFENLPPSYEKGLRAAPVSIENFIGIDRDAFDFYAEKAGDAERWLPELATKTPAEKMAKAVAILARHHRKEAGELILAWQRAQLAHAGINPDTGVNLVEERAEIEQRHQEKYAKLKAQAAAKQAMQDLLFAAAIIKQLADWQAAEAAHEKQIEKTKQQFEQKVAQHKKTSEATHVRVASAREHASKEGVGESVVKATVDKEGGGAAAAPSPPEALPPLEKPAPLQPRPPVPMPSPPAPLPPVVVPPAKLEVEDLMPSGPLGEEDDDSWLGRVMAEIEEPSAPPPDSQAVAESGGSVGKMAPGGAATKPSGAAIGEAAAGGGSGSDGSAAPAPAMVEGAGDMAKQGARLDAQLVAAGGQPKNAMASGDPLAMMAASDAALFDPSLASAPVDSAPVPARGAAPADGAAPGAPAVNAPAANAPIGVDPTVQAVTERGKAAEAKQAAEADRRADAYASKVHEGERQAGAVESALGKDEKAAHEKRERRAMPPPAAFPIATPKQIRSAYSNWTRLHLSGETLRSFTDCAGARLYFDFERRTWANVVVEYERLLRLGDLPPEPKEFVDKVLGGQIWDGAGFRRAAVFDPAYVLDDEALRAEDALERVRLLYRGCRPADYLVRVVEREGEEAKRHALAHTLVEPLCKGYEPHKALRAALDHLGPSREVQKQLGIVDGGKLVDPPMFWTRMLARFNADETGIAQVNDVIKRLQEAKEVAPPVSRVKPAAVAERVGEPNDPPRLAHWTDVSQRFRALAAPGALETLLESFGVNFLAPLAANREAMLAARKRELAALGDTMKGASPKQVHATWREDFRRRSVAHNRMVAELSRRYAALIVEVRATAPRLDARGVAQACAEFRARVGANALVFTIGDVNPAGIAANELVDPAIAHAHVDGADWNPLLDTEWLAAKYEPFDPVSNKK